MSLLVPAAQAAPPETLTASAPPPVRSVRRTAWLPSPRLLGPTALVGVWWLASATGRLDEDTLAPPGTVARTAWSMVTSGELPEALWVSTQRVLWGLGWGVTLGVVLAVLAGLSKWGEALIDTNIQILRTVPIIGVLPLLIIWFGIGETPKIVMISLAVMFPVYVNTFTAIRSVDQRLVETAGTLGLGRVGLVRHVLLPGALPGFLVGLRFALVVSWLVLVFSETVNAQRGLGFLLNNARTFYETDKIVVVLAVYGLIGLASDAVVRTLEGRLLSWRRTFDGR